MNMTSTSMYAQQMLQLPSIEEHLSKYLVLMIRPDKQLRASRSSGSHAFKKYGKGGCVFVVVVSTLLMTDVCDLCLFPMISMNVLLPLH